MVGYSKLFTSKKDQGARTPSAFLKQVQSMFCPNEKLFDPCPHGWSKQSSWDALRDPWKAINFINPPFDQVGDFFTRAIEQKEHCISIFLVPCRFHTKYFHQAAPYMKHIVLLSKQMKFVGYSTPLPVPMCLVVFGSNFTDLIHADFIERHQTHISFFSFGQANVQISEALTHCPENTHLIANEVSKPLQNFMETKSTDSIGLLLPSRLDNRVIVSEIVMNKDVEMIFFNPTLSNPRKLMNGHLLALFNNALPQNSNMLEEATRVPCSVLVNIEMGHDETQVDSHIYYSF